MRELDPLSLMVLAKEQPRRAVCTSFGRDTPINTLWHAECAYRVFATAKTNFRTHYLPVDNEVLTWGNGCISCSYRVETENLKPF